MSETNQNEQQPPKPKVRFKRPSEILAMIAADKAHIAQGRHILKKRFGFTDAQIDLGVTAQVGRAPAAAAHYAEAIKGDLPSKLTPAPARDIRTTPRKGDIF